MSCRPKLEMALVAMRDALSLALQPGASDEAVQPIATWSPARVRPWTQVSVGSKIWPARERRAVRYVESLVKPPTGAYSQDCIAGLVKGFYLILNRVNELKVPPPSSSTLERGVLTHFEFCTLNVLLSKLFFRFSYFLFC